MFLAITAGLIAPYLALRSLRLDAARRVQHFWYGFACYACGLTVRVKGQVAPAGCCIFVANHISYLDIPILGRVLGATFVAKRDVAGWPLIGWLARVAGTVFIDRDRMTARQGTAAVADCLRRRRRLVLFPEGTSSDGRTVLPFRSSLFAAASAMSDDDGLWVQPVTVAYTRYADGRMLQGSMGDLYAWYGDMTLVGHMARVFGLAGAAVEVTLHPPLRAVEFADRKVLASHCRNAVAMGLAESLRAAEFADRKVLASHCCNAVAMGLAESHFGRP